MPISLFQGRLSHLLWCHLMCAPTGASLPSTRSVDPGSEPGAPLLAYYPLFCTLAGTGIRLDETLAFQWEDLDGLVRELRVARSLSRGQVSTPKAGRGRTEDLSQVLAKTLEQLQQARTNEAFLLGWPALAPGSFTRGRARRWMKAKCDTPCGRC